MGYTNKTTHYELPQYVATDKPKYLTDFNETMVAIDTQMYTNAQAAATADSKAVAAQGTADGAVSSIGTLNTQINGDPTNPSDTGLAGEVSGIDTDLNTVQSLIGSGTPTTSNQTIIGAINSIEAAIAPREDGDNLANSYSTGDQFARGGSVYEALTSLTAGTAFTSLTLNTDYKAADTIVEQISDLNADVSALDNCNIAISISESIAAVTADGTKTNKQLLDELHMAVGTFKASLNDGEFFRYKAFLIAGRTYDIWSKQAIHKTDSHFTTIQMYDATDNKITYRQANFSGDCNFYLEDVIDTNGFASTSILDSVPSSGTMFRVRADVYKVI